MTPELVIERMLKDLERWEQDHTKSAFCWPDDSSCAESWHYHVHCEWVLAWNDTNRAKPINEFLREWLVPENVAPALKKAQEWEDQLEQSRIK